MDAQTKNRNPWRVVAQQETIFLKQTEEKTSQGWAAQLESLAVGSSRNPRVPTSEEEEEKEKERRGRLVGPGASRNKTLSTFLPTKQACGRADHVQPGELSAFIPKETKDGTDMSTQPDINTEKRIDNIISKGTTGLIDNPKDSTEKQIEGLVSQETEPVEATDSTGPPNPDTRPNDSSGTDNAKAGAAIFTVMASICEDNTCPSLEEQVELRHLCDQMPYLMTYKAYSESREEAKVFLAAVYDNSGSENWASFLSLHHLEFTVRAWEFNSRAAAYPAEERGFFVV
ncbi:hypothetical protein F66182_7462 [Fusarium sp. NRRL 66182]|nr:hypothetical protein F66182_7462 [Fusarium sp. NRRL 66182]